VIYLTHFPHEFYVWIIFILGLVLAVLFLIAIRMMLLSRQRARSLSQANLDLKKEITERENAEETKQKLEIALLQGQKLQAIGTLASGIAHDFNNILYAIIGYTEIAREDVTKDSLTYKNLGKVLDGCHRGQELISRILAFSRRQHQQFDIINLKSTIEAALALLRPTIPASVIIHFHANEKIIILGNQTQLHQVLVNLINNAVDAMDGEGTMDISIEHASEHDPLLKQLPAKIAPSYCKIVMKDTGHGMDQSMMERIFEPFFTTKEVGKGTGLGLSIVHSIVKEHGGDITVNSQLGHGATFTIILPEYKED